MSEPTSQQPVYITRYFLSKGIIETTDWKWTDKENWITFDESNKRCHLSDYFFDKEDAINNVKQLIDKKVKNYRKRIQNLEKKMSILFY